MSSNTIIAIRLANLSEQQDSAIDFLIDYDVLKIHCPQIKATREDKINYFRALRPNAKVKIQRVLEDGPNVAIHFRSIRPGHITVSFHIYRFNEKGKVVELWTNVQTEPQAGLDGIDLLSGPSEIKDKDKTEINRKQAHALYQKIAAGSGPGQLKDFFDLDNFVLHSLTPEKDPADGMVRMPADISKGQADSFELCLCSGNFTLAAIHSHTPGGSRSIFEWNRWDNGRITEQWKVIENIAPPQQWKNDWGKFSFFTK